MNATNDLLPNKLRMTAGIEDMAGRPFTANQLREAADTIASLTARIEALERDLSIEIDAGHDSTERAEAAELERDELRAKWQPLVTWAAAKEKAGKEES
jgi:hypothetical protein